MSYQRPTTITCARCRKVVSVGPMGRVPTYCSPSCRTVACQSKGRRPTTGRGEATCIDMGHSPGCRRDPRRQAAADAQIGGCGMTCKALTTVLALIALPMPASGTEHNLCHRWQRSLAATTATVGSLAAPLATPSLCMTACPVRCSATDPSGGNGEDQRQISEGEQKPPDQPKHRAVAVIEERPCPCPNVITTSRARKAH